MNFPPLAIAGLILSCPSLLRAGCCEHHDAAEAFQQAHALGEYRILSAESMAGPSGRLLTRFTASLNQALKGEAPAMLVFDTPGGRNGHRVEFSSLGLDLSPGEDCILHLRRNDDGSWAPLPFQSHRNRGTMAERRALRDYFRGGARGRMPAVAKPSNAEQTGTGQDHSGVPGSVVTPTGYAEPAGHPTRFTECDGGHPIPYQVDIDPAKLPPGMTPPAALEAVEQALGAWSAASSLKFHFEGSQSFGAAASSLPGDDGRLRIQLHDTYNAVTVPGVLGIGGGSFTSDPGILRGGSIGNQGFQERLGAYVVLRHNDDFMDDVDNFKLVLTHEIGHALGLAHSSNNPSEPDAILKNATMYYSASNDGRGAAITVYDEDRIAFGYPVSNTPPYATNRVIRAVSDSGSGNLPVVLGVNRIELRATDLQGGVLSPVLHANSSFRFSLAGNQLVYAANGFTAAPRLSDAEIESGASYGVGYLQFSDGTNLSRVARCTVIEIGSDSTPADGLPDGWMTTHFNTTVPAAAGSPGHPDSDPDGDGLTNREEYNLNTDPKSAASGPTPLAYDHASRILMLSPVRYASYGIESASSPAGPWTLRHVASRFAATGTIKLDVSETSSGPRQFYRARTGP
jgi:hypothetical protein